VGGGGAKEPPDCANVTLEGEIVGPTIGWFRLPSDDTFSLYDIERMQLKARCSNVSHGGSESTPNAEHPGSGHDRGLVNDGIRRPPEVTQTFGGRSTHMTPTNCGSSPKVVLNSKRHLY
jgi:hypothetical protein